MKLARFAIAALFALGFGRAYAFHDGGVAYCEGCHVMHNASNGVDNQTFTTLRNGKAVPGAKGVGQNPLTNITNAYLLQGVDQSSTCLMCHSGTGGYHMFDGANTNPGNAPTNYTPGGDFAWLLQSFSWTTPRAGSSLGNAHGHNIKADDFALVPKTGKFAPGGTYPADNLSCISCHDPHSRARIIDANGTIGYNVIGGAKSLPIAGSGSYGDVPPAGEALGVYRFLGGKNYQPDSLTGSFGFAADPPVAVAPATYNQSEATSEVHVAYGSGMAEWCANCHTNIHNDNYPTTLRHPSGNGATLTSAVVANYNAYIASGNLTGTVATSYTSMVPYEEGTASIGTLAARATNSAPNATQSAGPAVGTANVMCLSCHRAHASGWDKATRWNHQSTYLVVNGVWPGTDSADAEASSGDYAQGRTVAQTQAAMYQRAPTVYATFQRQLCNKCHAKD